MIDANTLNIINRKYFLINGSTLNKLEKLLPRNIFS